MRKKITAMLCLQHQDAPIKNKNIYAFVTAFILLIDAYIKKEKKKHAKTY